MDDDVVRQVAEMRCSGSDCDCRRCTCAGEKDCHNECSRCQGTGLRWPTLSREVPDFITGGYRRIPDVTLEKVMDLLEASQPPGIGRYCIYFEYEAMESPRALCALQLIRTGKDVFPAGVGTNRLEAACAALLAS